MATDVEEETNGVRAPAPARILVHVPADAQLTLNGKLSRLRQADRTFVTPPLRRGMTYYYNLKAEVTRDGEKLTESRRVVVRAGKKAEVTIRFPASSVAAR
jgi:uncharacterized protein (TIGR03000 family)